MGGVVCVRLDSDIAAIISITKPAVIRRKDDDRFFVYTLVRSLLRCQQTVVPCDVEPRGIHLEDSPSVKVARRRKIRRWTL